MKDPYGLFDDCYQRFGPIFRLHTIAPTVIVCDPEDVRAIFTADVEAFENKPPETQRRIFGEASLVLKSGAPHREERRAQNPSYQGEAVKAACRIVRTLTLKKVRQWKPGQVLVIREVLKEISAEVILKTVFGVIDDEKLDALREVVTEYVAAFSSPAFLMLSLFGLKLGKWGPQGRFERARTRLLDFTEAQIEATLKQGDAPDYSILASLLSAKYSDGRTFNPADLRDNLVTAMIAGYESTAFGMTWAFYWLCRNEPARSRLIEELDSLGAEPDPVEIARAPYLSAVVQEALRIYPVVPEMNRTLRKPLELGNYTIPAGDNVAACAYLTHRNPELFPEPDRFDPERFLKAKPSPYEYYPFGGGERRCIGMHFSLQEAKVVVGTVFKAARLQLHPDGAAEIRRIGFSMGPKDGLRVVYQGER